MNTDPSDIPETEKSNIINRLKRRETFIKFNSSGRTYSRIYYLSLSEDAIHYQGSRHKSKLKACRSNVKIEDTYARCLFRWNV
jgi:hypothetical protein